MIHELSNRRISHRYGVTLILKKVINIKCFESILASQMKYCKSDYCIQAHRHFVIRKQGVKKTLYKAQ